MQFIYHIKSNRIGLFLQKETDLHIPAQKIHGPSKSQKHTGRTTQESQFMLGGKWHVFEFDQV